MPIGEFAVALITLISQAIKLWEEGKISPAQMDAMAAALHEVPPPKEG